MRGAGVPKTIRALVWILWSSGAAASFAGDDEPRVIEEIIVTATRIERRGFDVSSAVDVVDRERLERRPARVVADFPRGEPGVFVQQTTSGQGIPIVRGLIGSSVLTLVDGMRLNNAIFRPAPNQYFSLLDPYEVERIEIVRGTASTLYGSDAIGGVVNVITPTPWFDDDEWQARGRALGQFGSADLSRIGHLALEGGRRGLGLRAGGTFQRFDDLRGGDGPQEPTAYAEGSASSAPPPNSSPSGSR